MSNKGKAIICSVLLVAVYLIINRKLQYSLICALNEVFNIQNVNKGNLLNGSDYVCVVFVGGLGNNIFQFASAFGISRSLGRQMFISRTSRITKVFKINVTFMNNDKYCKRLPLVKEHNDLFATYDDKMLTLNISGDVRVGLYLQSWKYFTNSQTDLKKQLLFHNHITQRAKILLKSILNYKTNDRITVIGIHVRRGDMVNNKLGFQVATLDYIKTAIAVYRNTFQNLAFVVTSNDISWCKKNLAADSTFVFFHNRPEVDMAVLSLCDHIIMTVGTYGWWAAWLSGGNVTYYKAPARKGTWWDNKLSIVDHFPPHWIGL